MLSYAATAATITISVGNYAPDYEPVYEREPYRRAPYSLDLLLDSDARRWMTGRFPPPVEVALASLPLPELAPACDLPRQPSRTIARARGRRPMRGRSGRPAHARAASQNAW